MARKKKIKRLAITFPVDQQMHNDYHTMKDRTGGASKAVLMRTAFNEFKEKHPKYFGG